MTRAVIALLLVAGFALAGCSRGDIDTESGAYGKASGETKLPPQGKPPAPGEDMAARARGNAPR